MDVENKIDAKEPVAEPKAAAMASRKSALRRLPMTVPEAPAMVAPPSGATERNDTEVAPVSSSTAEVEVEETMTVQEEPRASTPDDLDAAMKALLDYLSGSDKDVWKKAAESKDPERLTKILKPVIERWRKEETEKEERLSTFRGAAIELAHQAFDRLERNRASLTELVSSIGWHAKLEPAHAPEYAVELKKVLGDEKAAFSVPGDEDEDQSIIRLRNADKKETGEVRHSATPKRRRGRPKGSKNKTSSTTTRKPRKSGTRGREAGHGRAKEAWKNAGFADGPTAAQGKAYFAWFAKTFPRRAKVKENAELIKQWKSNTK